ncbi:DUF427 domain-containing protein [Cryptosporangium aurantiacum]|uniref:Uncharacterized conserved protein, DUF427 family n=1 Tax=Cryptosporangium aurantiacum TaxID=134849 RepID=A0A1M7RHM7_9ACTN|nr:DUF427 domain-containing protein [Cryptosporangium aurantiacum]SHN45815.1 Uncharacterized conserved protein, DUF427 family [Cryptosporangium aurantiacum]
MTTETEQKRGRVRVEPGLKRVRALVGGRVVADTRRPFFVWEKPYYPTYYVPRADVFAELVPTGEVSRSPSRGDGAVQDVVLPDRTLGSAAVLFPDSPVPELRDLVRLDWASMDEWLEEDEPVYVHPRDPYKRVDILSSSRHVQVSIDGVVVADSHQPRILFETSLPPRYYLPLTDVRLDLLRPSTLVTHCPYKGAATYWDVVLESGVVHSNVVWAYRSPLPESQKVTGLAAFYDEKVDVTLDGVRQERPRTHFS